MSPASSGNLEVEHYIGACLISQHRFKNHLKNNRFLQPDGYHQNNHHLKQQQQQQQQQPHHHHPPQHLQYHPNFQPFQKCNGSGGMPLIFNQTPAGIRGRDLKGKLDERVSTSPLARLAVHTQGAPLILTKPSYRKKAARNNKSFDPVNNVNKSKTVISKSELTSGGGGGGGGGADTVSVASDESTGSANSENCLPRIIKPRKRRKKDRKPPPALVRPLSHDGGFSTDNSASPDIDNNSNSSPPTLIENLTFNFDVYSYRTSCGGEEAPNLHHSFDDIEEVADINGNQPAISCQCRYCDPSGQIWDVDRNCYSPFLTRPKLQLAAPPMVPLGRTGYAAPISHFDSRCLEHSMSSVSLESNEENGTTGRKAGTTSGDLEVSTEIVTSLNGHRDLEIKFFSSASSATNSDNNNSTSTSDSSKSFHFINSRNEE